MKRPRTRARALCDASPLIFLAKLDRLDLISRVLHAEAIVLKCVADEVASERAGPLELARLRAFLDTTEVVEFEASNFPSASLSRSDQSILTWAVENKASFDVFLADEKLLRRVAQAQGIRVIGFLGLLVQAARRGVLGAAEAKEAIDDAVTKHGCRISVALYRRVVAELEGKG